MSEERFIPPGVMFVPGVDGTWVATSGWPDDGNRLLLPTFPLPSEVQCGEPDCGKDNLKPIAVGVVGHTMGVKWLMECPACEAKRWYPAMDMEPK